MRKARRILAGVMCLMALAGAGVAKPNIEAYAAESGIVTGVTVKNINTNGNSEVGDTLQATPIIPGYANIEDQIEYQWYRHLQGTNGTTGGTLIEGATSSYYDIKPEDAGKYLFVTVTGVNGYTGRASSEGNYITPKNLSIELKGTGKYGTNLTVRTYPSNATVNYQWYRHTNDTNGTTEGTLIEGATSGTYTVQAQDLGKHLFVKATGIVDFTGSTAIDSMLVEEMRVDINNGHVGDILTAEVSPTEATVSYQWYRHNRSINGIQNGTPIEGATSKTYTVQPEDLYKWLFVEVTGTGDFAGINCYDKTGDTIQKRSLSISLYGTEKSGETLEVTTDPSDATVTYQWYRYDSYITSENTIISDGTLINGATKSTYRLTSNDVGKHVYSVATGTDKYKGLTSMEGTFYKIEKGTDPINITSVKLNGEAAIGKTLTVAIEPSEATVDIEWKRADKNNNTTVIAGATDKSYTLTKEDVNSFIKVEVTGTGDYGGSLTATTPTAISSSGEGGNDIPDSSDGKLTDSSKDTQYETNDNFADEIYAGSNKSVEAHVTQGAQFTVIIPRKIVLDGKSGSGDYDVVVMGDIPGNQEINVEPKESTFTLSTVGKSSITANITQNKTKFSVALDTMEGLKSGAVAGGTIEANGLTAGKWTGIFNFVISVSEKAA